MQRMGSGRVCCTHIYMPINLHTHVLKVSNAALFWTLQAQLPAVRGSAQPGRDPRLPARAATLSALAPAEPLLEPRLAPQHGGADMFGRCSKGGPLNRLFPSGFPRPAKKGSTFRNTSNNGGRRNVAFSCARMQREDTSSGCKTTNMFDKVKTTFSPSSWTLHCLGRPC